VKKGLSSTLPLGLGRLQTQGRIRRVPTNGRLDQQRYKYAAWNPSPLAKVSMSLDDAFIELARRFFTWIGPATVAEFQWFSGLGVKAAKAAIEPLTLARLDEDSGRLMHEADLDALRAFKRPKDPQYALVSGLDAMVLLRRDVQGLLDEKDKAHKVVQDKTRVAAGAITDLPSHGIFDRGRLVGLWEYDHEAGSIAWASFGVKDKALKEAVARTEAFVRDDLGDARSFSLDSPKSRTARVEALRKGF
jgi:Winged helix DNA-binding domain